MIHQGREHSGRGMLFLLLVLVNGIIFVVSLPAVFDPSLGLQIHGDVPPDAGTLMIAIKSVICFLAGIAYLIAAYGYYKKSPVVLAGLLGAVPFFVLYLVEIASWGMHYPGVWKGFILFGLLSLVIGIGSWNFWNKFRNTDSGMW